MNIIIQNIKRIANNEGITISRLEHIIGASKGVLSRAVGNNSDIQSKWILKVIEIYPQYSCEWLLKNEGSMIKTQKSNNYQPSIKKTEDELSYKKLAEAQKDTIDSLKKVVFHLEKEISHYEKQESKIES
ncbi:MULTISPECIES: hypothetical protein [Flavobacterium]|uniref:hypothetical protein n=1 Tax=Flavobacterium TaxID=237 RepID=UPI002113A45E|nr:MULTISPECIES: hypothetical protein [Flavobacterium]UUF14464.1 hypothetical protein NLJ00_24785 [Flavobacterium panici]